MDDEMNWKSDAAAEIYDGIFNHGIRSRVWIFDVIARHYQRADDTARDANKPGKVTIDGIEHSDPDVIEKLEGR